MQTICLGHLGLLLSSEGDSRFESNTSCKIELGAWETSLLLRDYWSSRHSHRSGRQVAWRRTGWGLFKTTSRDPTQYFSCRLFIWCVQCMLDKPGWELGSHLGSLVLLGGRWTENPKHGWDQACLDVTDMLGGPFVLGRGRQQLCLCVVDVDFDYLGLVRGLVVQSVIHIMGWELGGLGRYFCQRGGAHYGESIGAHRSHRHYWAQTKLQESKLSNMLEIVALEGYLWYGARAGLAVECSLGSHRQFFSTQESFGVRVLMYAEIVKTSQRDPRTLSVAQKRSLLVGGTWVLLVGGGSLSSFIETG